MGPFKFLALLALTLTIAPLSTQAQDIQPSQWPHLSGYWKFQDTSHLTQGTIGKDLELIGTHQWVKGPERRDTAVRIGIGSYYKCIHGVSPNGGGDSVNQYTLMFDFKIANLNNWHTFFQTDTNNLNDGECFIRPSSQSNPGRIGTATTGYTPVAINVNQWYRLVISVNLGNYYRYYLNGQLVLDGNNQTVDDRFALNPYFLLFADNDQEDDTIDIASVAIFDTCLSSSQVYSLGTVDPCLLHPISIHLGNDTSLCGNNSLTKMLSKGVSYKWSTGDTDSTVTFNVNKLGLGTKSIWAEIKDIYGCTKRDTFELSIFSNPSVNLGKDTAFCKGPSYRLVAGSASGNTFEWKHLPSGVIVSKINSMTTDSTGLYAVKMTNSNGCSAYDSVQITAHPIPAKPVISYNKLQICQGDTFFISGTSGHANYIWSDGQNTQNIIRTIGGGLRLRVQSAFGCISPASDSITFNVIANPAAPSIIVVPDTAFCNGDSVLIYVNQNANYQYIKWNDGYNQFSRHIKHSGTYYAYITDYFLCKSDWSASIRTTELTRPSDPVISSLNGLHFCDGDTAFLSCTHDADSIVWSTGSNNDNISVNNGGKYWVEAFNNNGCKNNNKGELDIYFHPIPDKPIISLNIVEGNLFGPANAQKYEWKVEDVFYDTIRIIPLKVNQKIELRIKEDYCWSEWSDTVFYWDNIARINFERIGIYPNPSLSNDKIFIVNSIDLAECHLQIISNDGRLVYQQTGCDGSINISSLSSGLYTIMINSDGKYYLAQFIKS